MYVQNFENIWGGKWDHWESENRGLHAIWAHLLVEMGIFPTSSHVSYTFRVSDKEINILFFENLRTRRYSTPTEGIVHPRKV